MDRRFFLQGVSALPLAAASTRAASLAKHRNLFAGDSCTFFYNPELYHPEGLPYTAKAVHRYIDVLANNGVDTFVCNPNAQVAWYPSKKLQTMLDGYKRGDRSFFRAHADASHIPEQQLDSWLDKMTAFHNLYLDLADAGVDWLRESSKACRQRGISPWVSVRMNDTHGVENPASHFNCELYRNPAMQLSGRVPDPQAPPNPRWKALNYAKTEVRQFMMSHIREYLEDYDFEGMELDWLRDPHCLEPGASQAECNVVTDWLAEVRQRTNARGKQLKKAYPLGLRIPGSLGYLKSRGLDVKEVVRRGLVDFIGFSNFWQTSWDMPYDELRHELGPEVIFYGVVEDAPNWVFGQAAQPDKPADVSAAAHPNPGLRYLSASVEMLRANAAGKLAMGVHGIEQFNFFCTDQPNIPGLRANYSALRDVHDLQFLRGKPKHYCLSTGSGRLSSYWESPEQLPVTLQVKQRREFRLSMCHEPKQGRCMLQVVTTKQTQEPVLGASINGKSSDFRCKQAQNPVFPVGPYTQHVPEHVAWNFEFDASEILEGWNRFTIMNADHAPACNIVSFEIGVFV
jgi:hypothetical protein